MVERRLAKSEVAGSDPARRSIITNSGIMSWIVASAILFIMLVTSSFLFLKYKVKFITESFNNYSIYSYLTFVIDKLTELVAHTDDNELRAELSKLIDANNVTINKQMLINRGFEKATNHEGYYYSVYHDVLLWFPLEEGKENFCHLIYNRNGEEPVVISTFNIMTNYHLKTMMRFFEGRMSSDYKRISKKYYTDKKIKDQYK